MTPDELFERNKHLAKFAVRVFRKGLTQRQLDRMQDDELWQAALLGLMSAAKHYDPVKRTCKFTTFAVKRMRRRMREAVADSTPEPGIRLPAEDVQRDDAPEPNVEDGYTMREMLAHLTGRQRRVIELRYKRHLTMQRTSELMGISRQRVEQIERKALETLRLKVRRPW